MDFNSKPSPSEACHETMDFLSRTWCNFAVQALQPQLYDQSIVVLDNQIKTFESDSSLSFTVNFKILKHVIYILLLQILYVYGIDKKKLNPSFYDWQNTEKSAKIDATDFKSSLPPWKSDDVKVIKSIIMFHKIYVLEMELLKKYLFLLIIFLSWTEVIDCSCYLQSWIWMQQAMHPELNYNSCFRKKWVGVYNTIYIGV